MRVLVIGAGPAGMMAALEARQNGHQVDLLEGKDTVGKKLKLTGNGRANLAPDIRDEDFLPACNPGAKVLYRALKTFPIQWIRDRFFELGCPLKAFPNGRIYPQSENAGEVVNALHRALIQSGVRIHCARRVLQIESPGTVYDDKGGCWKADIVCLCTGGVTFPVTGSCGDGHRMAKALGLPLTPLIPIEVPLVSHHPWIQSKALQGTVLKDITVEALLHERPVARESGDLLITHFGFSGPAILPLSEHFASPLPWSVSEVRNPSLSKTGAPRATQLRIHFPEIADALSVRGQFKSQIQKKDLPELEAIIRRCYPKSLLTLHPGLPLQQSLLNLKKTRIPSLARLDFPIEGTLGLKHAIVSAGGIDCKALDPKTLRMKALPWLGAAGELLDIHGPIGGYNLSLALISGAFLGHQIPDAWSKDSESALNQNVTDSRYA